MLEPIIEKKKNEADQLAERKKAEIEYISNIAIEYVNYLPNIYADYSPHIYGLSKHRESFEERVFNDALKNIEEIREYCRPVVVRIYKGKPKDYFSILYKLRWVSLYLEKDQDTYIIKATKKGIKILYGLRKIRGQSPVKEENEKIMKELFGKQTT